MQRSREGKRGHERRKVGKDMVSKKESSCKGKE